MRSSRLPFLETFAKAAELSCFSAAARGLGLTQAAVSQQIHTLEKAVGTGLFHRSGGRVLLTPAGSRLYGFAERILALQEEALRKVAGQRAVVVGAVGVAASSIPGEHLLPALLPAFRRRYPHIQIRATVTDTRAVLGDVETGRAHLGLVSVRAESEHLEFRSFACDEMMLVVPVGHRWWGRKRVPLEQFLRQPLILREPGSGSRWCLEWALERSGRSAGDLQVAVELGSNEGIKEAVLRGVGVAVLSTRAVKKELAARKLHALKVQGLCLERDLFAVWDTRRALPAQARRFLEFLGSSAEQAETP
jgi:DNA-binding transcriptional LysR family regulator